MGVAELVYFAIGIILGYGLSTKERRKAILAKLNEWTRPKKEPEPKEPSKP